MNRVLYKNVLQPNLAEFVGHLAEIESTKYVYLATNKTNEADHRTKVDILTCLQGQQAIIFNANGSKLGYLSKLYVLATLTRYCKVYLVTESIETYTLDFLKSNQLQCIICHDEIFRESSYHHENFFISPLIKIQYSKHQQPFQLLSFCEFEILYLFSLGWGNKLVAETACKSYHTVKNHKVNITRKFGLEGCHELLGTALHMQQLNF